ncbi:MAG: IS1595 family transposase [Acidimicrobiales bacterium]
MEVDETYIGGEEPGLRGGRAKGKKALIGVAIEVKEPRGYGRCRMAILADGSVASLHPFVTDHVAPGATVITDGWPGYAGIEGLGYTHEPRSQSAARARGDDPGELLPGVHRVAPLVKRWLLGTHQGLVEVAHLQSYLNVLLRWPEASAMSVGARDRQCRTGSLEVITVLPSPRFSPSASGCMGTSGSAAAVSPTSVTEHVPAEQVFSH